MYAKLPSGARGQDVGLSLHLLPYFMYGRNKGSDETAQMCKLVRAFASHERISALSVFSNHEVCMLLYTILALKPKSALFYGLRYNVHNNLAYIMTTL